MNNISLYSISRVRLFEIIAQCGFEFQLCQAGELFASAWLSPEQVESINNRWPKAVWAY